jgi:hypothetical protein
MSHISETRLQTELREVEERANIMATALRRICTAGSLVKGDPFDDVYRKAGGGYCGLQEMAVKALELAGISR